MSKKLKTLSTAGSIRLLRKDKDFKILGEGDSLKDGDIVELLSPISQISIKTKNDVVEFSGPCRLKIEDKKILDITNEPKKEPKKEKEDQNSHEIVEEIEFDIGEFLGSKLEKMELLHIVDQKALLVDIDPDQARFYAKVEELTPDMGCLILGTSDKVTIKKYSKRIKFTVSVYIFHEAHISKFTSYPKDYTFVGEDENGLFHIKKDLSLEFKISV